jgi:hypothetical protein
MCNPASFRVLPLASGAWGCYMFGARGGGELRLNGIIAGIEAPHSRNADPSQKPGTPGPRATYPLRTREAGRTGIAYSPPDAEATW